MIASELKKALIQYAVQGKLTEQLTNDSDGREYYLKNYNLGELTEESDFLFDIPENWIWVKLGAISKYISKGTTPTGGKESYLSSGIPFIRAENVSSTGKVDFTNIRYIDINTHNTVLKRSKLKSKDLLICIAGTLGRSAILDDKYTEINTNQAVSFVRLISHSDFDVYYIRYCISSDMIQKKLVSKNKVTAIPNLTLEIIRDISIPLPPLSEQKRIVEKLDKILPLIDELEKDENKLNDLMQYFPKTMKASILQAAIQGRLTEQIPSNELTSREQPKNIRLFQSDELDDLPFEIPDNWAWALLAEIAYIDGGFAFKSTQYKQNGTRVLRISDFSSQGLLEKNKVYYNFESYLSKYLIKDFDIVMCMTGGTVGKNYMFDIIQEPLLLNQRVARISTKSKMVIQEYIYYVINSKYIQNKIKASKNSTNDNISMKDIQNFMIPIPPLSDQKRIIERLHQILPIVIKINNEQL